MSEFIKIVKMQGEPMIVPKARVFEINNESKIIAGCTFNLVLPDGRMVGIVAKGTVDDYAKLMCDQPDLLKLH